jgi:XTP/dITP diphosphohydrolase
VKRLLVATRNAGKLVELRALLGEELALETLDAHPEVGDLDEPGETFEENARAKAVRAAHAAKLFVLGEDSGLEVDVLGGAPGVRSARYAGGHGDDAANLAKLMRELAAATDRRARFVCVAASRTPTAGSWPRRAAPARVQSRLPPAEATASATTPCSFPPPGPIGRWPSSRATRKPP